MAEGVGFLFGPMLIGVFLNCILYGAMVVQTFIYFQTYKMDARWIKMFVLYLLVLETLNTSFDIAIIYEPLITRYGTVRAVTFLPKMLSAAPASTVMISTPVQLFIAWRVKIMSRSIVLPAIISFLAIASFTGGITTAVYVGIFNKYVQFHDFDGAPITWLASSTAADILITASLVYTLSRQRTGIAATDDLINRIIRLTVQTGMVTSVVALLDIALFMAFKRTALNFMWDLPLSKLYSNSLLSTLNARGGWKATSPESVRHNVLFGSGNNGGRVARNRTQVEFAAVDPQTGWSSIMLPMKVFDSGARDHHELVINIAPEFAEEA